LTSRQIEIESSFSAVTQLSLTAVIWKQTWVGVQLGWNFAG